MLLYHKLFSFVSVVENVTSACRIDISSHALYCVCVLDEQVEAVRTEMQATVARLDTELTELQQSRTALQHDSAQQLESLDRLRRENTELQQRVSDVDVSWHIIITFLDKCIHCLSSAMHG